jgi:hypothetical protein
MPETLPPNPSDGDSSDARAFLADVATKLQGLPRRLSVVARSAPDLDPNVLPSLETFERLTSSLAEQLNREVASASPATVEQYRQSLASLAVEPLLRSADGLLSSAESDGFTGPNARLSVWDIIKCVIAAVKCVVNAILEVLPRALRRIFYVIYQLLCCIEDLICCLAGERTAAAAA